MLLEILGGVIVINLIIKKSILKLPQKASIDFLRKSFIRFLF